MKINLIIKRISFLLLISLNMAFMSNDAKTIYYYKLTKLQRAAAPERIKLINVNNLSRGKLIASDGVLFTYKDRNASKVSIGGNFTSWKTVKMTRGKDGVWFYFLPLTEFSKNITYKYNIDGLWTEDPFNIDKRDDMSGAYLSYVPNKGATEGKQLTFRIMDDSSVEFRLYKPSARIISLVGDFNNWNPENDLLKRDGNGIWRLNKKLLSGKYRYKFIVDGEWTADIYNSQSGTDNTGDICSIININ